MVISTLNTGRVLEIIRLLESYLIELKPFSAISKEEFLADRKNPPFVESYLRRSLEAVFDIGRHILAKSYGFKGIDYKTIAKALGERGIITEDLSLVLVKMAGYRNRMVHFYKEVNNEELYAILKSNLNDFDRFTQQIVSFLKAYEKQIQ